MVGVLRLTNTALGSCRHPIVWLAVRAGQKHLVHPKLVGDATEAMVIARLVQAGKNVLLPFGENRRYDLVIDEGDHFVRVQCKTGRLRSGAIRFNTCSSTYHHPNNQGTKAYHRGYAGEADLFGVYVRENDRVYLIPVTQVGTREGVLRVDPSRNNQSARVRWARDFEVPRPG
jgi:hypothetical protein